MFKAIKVWWLRRVARKQFNQYQRVKASFNGARYSDIHTKNDVKDQVFKFNTTMEKLEKLTGNQWTFRLME